MAAGISAAVMEVPQYQRFNEAAAEWPREWPAAEKAAALAKKLQ